MATVHLIDSLSHGEVADHPAWSHLDEATREKLLHEDLTAGESVVGLLLAIIAFGAVLGITAVTVVILTTL